MRGTNIRQEASLSVDSDPSTESGMLTLYMSQLAFTMDTFATRATDQSYNGTWIPSLSPDQTGPSSPVAREESQPQGSAPEATAPEATAPEATAPEATASEPNRTRIGSMLHLSSFHRSNSEEFVRIPIRLLCSFTDPEQQECPISLETPEVSHRNLLGNSAFVAGCPELKVVKLPCGHEFAAAPLLFYFYQTKMQCPLCRLGPESPMNLYCFPDEIKRKFQLHKMRLSLDMKITSLKNCIHRFFNFMEAYAESAAARVAQRESRLVQGVMRQEALIQRSSQQHSLEQHSPEQQGQEAEHNDGNSSDIRTVRQSLGFYNTALNHSLSVEDLCFQYLTMKLKLQVILQTIENGRSKNVMQIMVPMYAANEGIPVLPNRDLAATNLFIQFAIPTQDIVRINHGLTSTNATLIRFEVLKGADRSWYNIIDSTQDMNLDSNPRRDTRIRGLLNNSGSSIDYFERRKRLTCLSVNLNFFYLMKESKNLTPSSSWERTSVNWADSTGFIQGRRQQSNPDDLQHSDDSGYSPRSSRDMNSVRRDLMADFAAAHPIDGILPFPISEPIIAVD